MFWGFSSWEGRHVATGTHETAAAALNAAQCQGSSGRGLGTHGLPNEITSLRHFRRNEWCASCRGKVTPFHGSLHTNPLSFFSVPTGLQPVLHMEGISVPETLSFLSSPLPSCPLWLIPQPHVCTHMHTHVRTHPVSHVLTCMRPREPRIRESIQTCGSIQQRGGKGRMAVISVAG